MARGFPIDKDGPDPVDVGTTALEARQALEGIVHGAGLLSGGVVTGTGGWAYSVAPAYIAQRRDVGDGISIGYHPGGTVATDPAPATGSRYDIIYAHQQDVSHGDADGDLVLGCAIGTPHATTPVEPTPPTGAVRLARALVTASATDTGDATIGVTTVTYGDITPVNRGGTGARTAADARTALGAAAAWPARANRAVTARRTDTGSVGTGSMTSILSLSLPSGAPAGLYQVDIDVLLTATAAGAVDVRATTSSPVVNLTLDEKMYVTADGGRGHWTAHLEHSGGARTITLYVQPAVSGITAGPGSRMAVAWIGPLA